MPHCNSYLSGRGDAEKMRLRRRQHLTEMAASRETTEAYTKRKRATRMLQGHEARAVSPKSVIKE